MSDLLTLAAVELRQERRTASYRSEPERIARPRLEVFIRDHLFSAGVLGVALAYATLRYNVFKGVPWPDWPSYTLNKAFAVGSLLLIAAAVWRLARKHAGTGTLLGWAGALALTHSLLSFALFTPLYFPRLFEAGKLTFSAGLAITLGVGAIAAMELGARRSGSWSSGLRHAALALIAFASGIHASLPALATWVDPATWPGGLPPLTLISFLTGTAALAMWLIRASSRNPNNKDA